MSRQPYGSALLGVLLAVLLAGFLLVFAAALLSSQPSALAANRTGVFVFPFGFAVVSGAAGWLAFALALVFIVVFFVLAFLFVFQGLRWASRGAQQAYHYDRALEELRLRYARGEITREQYEQMLRDLMEKYY